MIGTQDVLKSFCFFCVRDKRRKKTVLRYNKCKMIFFVLFKIFLFFCATSVPFSQSGFSLPDQLFDKLTNQYSNIPFDTFAVSKLSQKSGPHYNLQAPPNLNFIIFFTDKWCQLSRLVSPTMGKIGNPLIHKGALCVQSKRPFFLQKKMKKILCKTFFISSKKRKKENNIFFMQSSQNYLFQKINQNKSNRLCNIFCSKQYLQIPRTSKAQFYNR